MAISISQYIDCFSKRAKTSFALDENTARKAKALADKTSAEIEQYLAESKR